MCVCVCVLLGVLLTGMMGCEFVTSDYDRCGSLGCGGFVCVCVCFSWCFACRCDGFASLSFFFLLIELGFVIVFFLLANLGFVIWKRRVVVGPFIYFFIFFFCVVDFGCHSGG